jgi:NifB/MoaA-like Fe-S oxidoreductase
VVTGRYGALMFAELFAGSEFAEIPVICVENEHFGGNTAVAGLLTYSDIVRTLRLQNGENVYLLPDVCLNDGVFLDGATFEDLAREFDVEIVPTSGAALLRRLQEAQKAAAHD